jgi:transcriptional regulator with XRE-family HTH domain
MHPDLCGRGALPNVDQVAKAWETDLSGRVGTAIQARRKALKMTAQELAERTKALGYHVTRVAISKIEGNLRAGKLDLAEVLVLAVVLDIPLALLVFPGFPEGTVEVLPGRTADNQAAVNWLAGRSSHRQVAADNDGTALIEDVEKRHQLAAELYDLEKRLADESLSAQIVAPMIKERTAQLATTEERIDRIKAQLWGTGEGRADG